MRPAPRTLGRRLGRAVALVVLVVLVAAHAALAAVVSPFPLVEVPEVAVVSGSSMAPTLRDGDLLVLSPRARYGVGDLVAFRVPADQQAGGTRVVHRIVGVAGDGSFITRGDQRPTDDPWRPSAADVRGTVRWRVPLVGHLLRWPDGPLVVGGLLTFLACAWYLWASASARDPRAPLALEPARVASALRAAHAVADGPSGRSAVRGAMFELSIAFTTIDPDFDRMAFFDACGLWDQRETGIDLVERGDPEVGDQQQASVSADPPTVVPT